MNPASSNEPTEASAQSLFQVVVRSLWAGLTLEVLLLLALSLAWRLAYWEWPPASLLAYSSVTGVAIGLAFALADVCAERYGLACGVLIGSAAAPGVLVAGRFVLKWQASGGTWLEVLLGVTNTPPSAWWQGALLFATGAAALYGPLLAARRHEVGAPGQALSMAAGGALWCLIVALASPTLTEFNAGFYVVLVGARIFFPFLLKVGDRLASWLLARLGQHYETTPKSEQISWRPAASLGVLSMCLVVGVVLPLAWYPYESAETTLLRFRAMDGTPASQFALGSFLSAQQPATGVAYGYAEALRGNRLGKGTKQWFADGYQDAQRDGLAWLLRAAKRGHLEAMYLAWFHDRNNSEPWLYLAAEANHPLAVLQRGIICEGRNQPREAARWYRRVIEQRGNVNAWVRLGAMLSEPPFATPADHAEARILRIQAAEMGVAQAAIALLEVEGDPRFSPAKKFKRTDSFALARLLENEGHTKAAIHWYGLAGNQGDPKAADRYHALTGWTISVAADGITYAQCQSARCGVGHPANQ